MIGFDLAVEEGPQGGFGGGGIRGAPDGDFDAALTAMAFASEGGEEARGDGVVFAEMGGGIAAADVFGERIEDEDILGAVAEMVGIDGEKGFADGNT